MGMHGSSQSSGCMWSVIATVIGSLIVAGLLGLFHGVVRSPGGPGPPGSATPTGGGPPVSTSHVPSPNEPAPGSLPGSFVGKWSGNAVQYNTSQQYPVILSFYSAAIGSQVGMSNYPTLKCSGTLLLRAIEGNKIFVTEYITENVDSACGTPDPLSLQFNKNGTLTYQELSDYTDLATVIGEGTLKRS
jgi:hypothetical protein